MLSLSCLRILEMDLMFGTPAAGTAVGVPDPGGSLGPCTTRGVLWSRVPPGWGGAWGGFGGLGVCVGGGAVSGSFACYSPSDSLINPWRSLCTDCGLIVICPGASLTGLVQVLPQARIAY